MVIPYCILNCAVLVLVSYLQEKHKFRIHLQPEGHELMSLLIAYLVVSKVTLAFNRYMSLRAAIGRVFLAIRETNQLALLFTDQEVTKEADDFRNSVSFWRFFMFTTRFAQILWEKHLITILM